MSDLLLRPSRTNGRNGVIVEAGTSLAGWRLLSFSARRLADGAQWQGETGSCEACLVLQSGACQIRWEGGAEHVMGPRASVFSSYPHAAYLPPGTRFHIKALQDCELAQGQAPARKSCPPRLIRPQECGFEIRGGGNATRQIVDIMPPNFPADRLLACEVYTPSGNWSSYPPHKHDADRPPQEVRLEEFYYYRFEKPEAYGFQRIYSDDGSLDETIHVEDRDLVMIPRGYHPFVTAYGFNAYYLNFLAGERRSMASSDDPRYAEFKETWPPPDPRVPIVPRPGGDVGKKRGD